MKVLIADDHALFRDSLATLLEAKGHRVVGTAADGAAAVEMAERLRPDVALIDLAMPGMDGLEATRQLAEKAPQVTVLILTGSEDDRDLFAALRAGARGYLIKNLEAQRFLDLLEQAARGELALTPALAKSFLSELSRSNGATDPDALTDREKEVLQLMTGGVTSNRKLARQLGVSENTVKFHVRNILDKLHLNSRAQAVDYALRHRLVDGQRIS